MKSQSATSTVAMNITNPAAGNMPVIYVGLGATLDAAITNNTGSDITLQQDSSMEIYMPFYFTAEEVAAMTIDSISESGWKFSVANDGGLLLSYANSSGIFAAGSVLSFTIQNVLSSAQPASDTVQVNFNNMSGNNVPSQITTPLGLLTPVTPGNADLRNTLQESFINDSVFVSVLTDPISNTLYLNFKNTGTTPLYNGVTKWQGNPQVTVSFAYGNTSGALAPDTKVATPGLGSAWNIAASVYVDQTAGWTVQNPSPTGNTNSPAWILAPSNSNQQVIGINTNSNVTFAFSNLFSFTPAGSTQMYIQFSGFRQDENTPYNDAVFVLDIEKESNPDRGITSLTSAEPYVVTNAFDTRTSVQVGLSWEGSYIGAVAIRYTIAGQSAVSPFSKNYPDNNFPGFDSAVLTIPDVTVGDVIDFTIYAYEADGVTEINSQQFSVTVDQQPDAYVFSCAAQTDYVLTQSTSVALNWEVAGAASIEITSDVQGIGPYPKTYDPNSGLDTDSTTISVSNPTPGVTVTFTLTAYDAHDTVLNTRECSTVLNPTTWCDPNDNNKEYNVVFANNQVWLARNYDLNNDSGGGSMFYNNDPGNEVQYGRLYTQAQAVTNNPSGWRLPTIDDWNSLVNFYGSNAGQEMFASGSGINLQFGGFWIQASNGFMGMGGNGTYWAAPDASDPDDFGALIYTIGGQPGAGPFSSGGGDQFFDACSVRYVFNT